MTRRSDNGQREQTFSPEDFEAEITVLLGGDDLVANRRAGQARLGSSATLEIGAMDLQVRAARRINLALQGGGAHGAFTWGVLDRLLEE